MIQVTKMKHPLIVLQFDCHACGKEFYAPEGINTCPLCFNSMGVHEGSDPMPLPTGQVAQWCENEHEEPLNTLFVGYDIPAALDYKHDILLDQLDKMGFQRADLKGDVVHIIPESRVAEVVGMLEDANEEHDFNLTDDFEPYRGQTELHCTIKLTGKTTDDLLDALKEVKRLLGDTFTSGHNKSDSGSFVFDVKEVTKDDDA